MLISTTHSLHKQKKGPQPPQTQLNTLYISKGAILFFICFCCAKVYNFLSSLPLCCLACQLYLASSPSFLAAPQPQAHLPQTLGLRLNFLCPCSNPFLHQKSTRRCLCSFLLFFPFAIVKINKRKYVCSFRSNQ